MTTSITSWDVKKLGEYFTIKHGYAFKGKFFSNSGQYIVVTPGNFVDEGGFKRVPGKEKYYVGDFDHNYILKKNDLIVVMTEQAEGLLGSSAIVPQDNVYLHNQRIGLVENLVETKVDRTFLYYLFNTKHVRQQIRATASGLKVRHTAPSRICDVEFHKPPLDTQKKIASILSAYDDLIENNLRRIRILEEMAQLIYREWFVKFRFPGHEKVKMVDSPLGEIPEGWQVKQIGDIANVFRGRSYRSKELTEDGGLPFVNLKCVDRDGGFRINGLKRYNGPFKETQIVRPGEIVIAVTDMTQERRIVARAARVPDFGEDKSIVSMDLVKIAPKEKISGGYLYGVLRFSSFPDEVKQHANGVNVLHLHPDRIREYSLPLPPHILRDAYERFIAPTYTICDNLNKKNILLRQTRDLLLPKLISGLLDVSELDIDIEDSAS